jgi:tape measure domain-containing protein
MGNPNDVSLKIIAEDLLSKVVEAAEQSLKDLGRAGGEVSDRLSRAFRTLNIKSAFDLGRERAQAIRAFEQIRDSGSASAKEIERAWEATRAKLRALSAEKNGIKDVGGAAEDAARHGALLGGQLGNIRSVLASIGAAVGAVGLVDLMKQSVDAALKMQQLDIMFKTVAGSSSLAQKEMEFVRGEADRLGLEFSSTAEAYAKFAASTMNSSIAGEKTRQVFIGVTEAVSAMHLPAENAQRAFLQLSQMMSKGRVTAEDFNVLAESVPGVLDLVAKKLNMTSMEFKNMMSSGKAISSDVIPALGEALHEAFGGAAVEAAKSAQSEINRFKNEIFGAAVAIGEKLLPVLLGAMDFIKGLISAFQALAKGVQWALQTFLPFGITLKDMTAAFVAAAVGIGAYNVAMTIAEAKTLALGRALLKNPIYLLFAGIAAATVGLAKAVNWLGDKYLETGDKSRKMWEEQKKNAEEAMTRQGEIKKRQEDYDATMGLSLERRIEKEKDAYGKGINAIEAYYRDQIEAAAGNKEKIARLEAQKNEDLDRLWKTYLTNVEKYRVEERNKDLSFQKESLQRTDAYAKAMGDSREAVINAYRKGTLDKIEDITRYYDFEIEKAQGNVLSVLSLEDAKQKAIEKIKEQAKQNHLLIGLDLQKKEIEQAQEGMQEQIAVIKQKVQERLITEREGQQEILALENDTARKLYENRLEYLSTVRSIYGEESEEFKAALREMQAAHRAYLSKQGEGFAQARNEAKAEREKESLDYRLELEKRLAWLKDSEEQGLITAKQAAREKLEAEVAYLERVSELRARALAEESPDSVAYKRALAARFQADREYYEKKKELDRLQWQEYADNLKRQETESAAEAEASTKQLRSFAEWFYAAWDTITARVTSLGPKVAAAFGVVVKQAADDTLEGIRAKLDEVADAIRQAGIASRDYFQFSRILGEHAEKAEKLRYEYYSQKLAVMELTEQLKKMGLASGHQLQLASNLIDNMDLLNDSDLQDVRSEVERLTDSLKEAEEQARDTVDSLRDELDEMLGNREAIENRDYEEKRAELERKLKDAELAGNTQIAQEYREALSLLDEVHRRKLENIRTEAEEARIADEQRHTEELERIAEEKKAREDALKAGVPPSAIPGFATGGRIPGVDSPVDNVLIKARTGEWVVRNEAVNFWESQVGRGFMSAINTPWSAAGQQIRARLSELRGNWREAIVLPTPKVAFATGGMVLPAPSSGETTRNERPMVNNWYITTQEFDERTIRRKVIPTLERIEKRKK